MTLKLISGKAPAVLLKRGGPVTIATGRRAVAPPAGAKGDPGDPGPVGDSILNLINQYPNAGRFSNVTAANLRRLDTASYAYYASANFTELNFATTALGGSFIHNNTDFGGSAGAMTSSLVDLMNKSATLATIDKRYGSTFNTALTTAGSGTAAGGGGPHAGMYSMLIPFQPLSFSSPLTCSVWARNRSASNDVGFICSTIETDLSTFALDGVLAPGSIDGSGRGILTAADGWKHFSIQTVARDLGYLSNIFRFYGVAGDQVETALPTILPGAIPVNKIPLAAKVLMGTL